MRRFLIGAVALLAVGASAAFLARDRLAASVEGGGGVAALFPWLGGEADRDFILVSGNIEAHESILSFKGVQSRIVELPFDEGQSVKAGTVIARVDDSDYRQQVSIAEAALNERTRQLDVAQQNVAAARRTIVSDQAEVSLRLLQYDRAQALMTKGAGTIDARDVAETALTQARAALDRDNALEAVAERTVEASIAAIQTAKANLELTRITLGYTTLVAPFDGVVLVRQAELGEVVAPGAAIVTLADIDHVWLRAYINETDIGKVRLGEAATVTTELVPRQELSGADFVDRRAGRVHAEKRRDPRGAGDARLSNPHRHRQSDARARPRPAGRREDRRQGAWDVMSGGRRLHPAPRAGASTGGVIARARRGAGTRNPSPACWGRIDAPALREEKDCEGPSP